MAQPSTIKERASLALQDEFLRKAVKTTTNKLFFGKVQAQQSLGDWEWWRERGRAIRAHVLAHLDYYLGQLIDRVKEAGGHVHICETAEDAVRVVTEIAQKRGAKSVIKSKSMVSEEVHLNRALEQIGVRPVETDLGEYIIQLAHEAPSHIIAPAIHKNRQQIAELFSEVAGHSLSTDTQTLTAFARRKLREEFLNGDIGVTGCNFAIAETGSICLFTNEGNGRMVTSLPPVHIAIMGMERVLPTFEDLEVMMYLLPRSGTGQKLTSYVTVITGPRRDGEADGPEEFHLLIVDNGRSRILKDPRFREALQCIRCGACLNVCPVYRQIGGHAYGWVYPGPIGAVITPLLQDDLDQWGDLPYASSLCAACYEACPVKIPLHDMLVRHRVRYVAAGKTPPAERLAFRVFKRAFGHARRYRLAVRAASKLQRPFVRNRHLRAKLPGLAGWTMSRDFPAVAPRRFRDLWPELAAEAVREKGGEKGE
ncbi:MAG: iron-sulfur cluster-binding protein [Alicyclobacillaceae bacterium]|nr:iron-sulfur cluster-binding protein [Alicyclobacillaceae bacterium]